MTESIAATSGFMLGDTAGSRIMGLPVEGAVPSFGSYLERAADQRSAQDQARKSKDRRDAGAAGDTRRQPNPTDMAVQELSSPAPLKETVAAAKADESKTSEAPRASEPTRSAASGAASAQQPSPAPRAPSSGWGAPDTTDAAAGRAAAPAQAQQTDQRSGTQDRRDKPTDQSSDASQPPAPVPAAGAAQAASASAAISVPGPAPSTAAAAEPNDADATRGVAPVGALKDSAGVKTTPRDIKPQPTVDAQTDKLAAQVGRGLAAALRQNGGVVTLRMKPEELGEVRIRLQLREGRVDAQFEVQSDRTRTLLDKTIGSLRSALESQGLTVDRLTIHTAETPGRTEHAAQSSDPGGSGPSFAEGHGNHAGGDAGSQSHGWRGAESAGSGGPEVAPESVAEPETESRPSRAGNDPGGVTGGAPNVLIRLDAVA